MPHLLKAVLYTSPVPTTSRRRAEKCLAEAQGLRKELFEIATHL
jgi:hypothetical protein